MAHFTYNPTDVSTLKQGDVIRRTDEIFKIITEVHPYFASDNYDFFLVLTQSCDLQRRDGVKCKSRYITISAIRSLEECLKREIAPLLTLDIEKKTSKIVDDKNKSKVREVLEKLLNNNHPEYFYLHQSLEHGLTDPIIAFLRVSIALKAELHYDILLKAKMLELKDEFKAKLGWLVGNLYSRVGTEDWVPKTLTKENFNRMILGLLDANFAWVSNLKEVENMFKSKYGDEQIEKLSDEEIAKELAQFKVVTKKDKILGKIGEILEASPGLEAQKILLKIKNDPTIASLLK